MAAGTSRFSASVFTNVLWGDWVGYVLNDVEGYGELVLHSKSSDDRRDLVRQSAPLEASLCGRKTLPWKEPVVELSLGVCHGILVTNAQRIVTFGCNGFGQLGVPNITAQNTFSNTFTDITDTISVSFSKAYVATGPRQTFVTLSLNNTTSAVYSFGANHLGQLGRGTCTRCEPLPQRVLLVRPSVSYLRRCI